MIKKIALLIMGLICAGITSHAQFTPDPYVEAQHKSAYSQMNIIAVGVEPEATYVAIEQITSRTSREILVSFSENTLLTYAGTRLKIREWGLFDNNEYYKKDLDTKYSLRADRKYTYILTFPPIPSYVNKISIRENTSDGMYWHGIHLNTEAAKVEREDYFTPKGSGTCFAINSDGYIATCHHVVEGAREFRIRGIGNDFNKTYKARLVSTDKNKDLAILKIYDSSFRGFGNIPYRISSLIADVGEDVYVLGYPLRAIMGDEIKLTNGVVSSHSGFQGDRKTYQVSATVQMGNSGGPVFDANGNVIGVVNARLAVESASYVVKSTYLNSNAIEIGIRTNNTNSLQGLPLAEQIKRIKPFVYIIEVQ